MGRKGLSFGNQPVYSSRIPLGSRRFQAVLVSGLFWLNLFRPNPEIAPGVIAVFWLDAVYVGVALTLLMFALIDGRHIKLGWVIFSLGMLLLALFPLVFGAIEYKITYSIRLIYVTVFLPILFGVWFQAGSKVPTLYAKALLFSAAPIGAIVFFQLMHFYPVTDWVHWLWGTDKLRSLQSTSPRVYGSFYNANWFGVYSVFLAVCAWGLFHIRQIGKLSFALHLLLAVAFIVVSGSRTALIGLAVVVVSALLVLGVQRGIRQFVRVTVGLFLGLVVILFSAGRFLDERFLKRWLELFSGEGVVSAAGRFATWASSWSRVSENPLGGGGVMGIPHNSYLATLEAFGLMFGGLVLGFYVALVGSSWLLAKRQEATIVVPILMAFSVMAGTAEFFYTTQLMILVVPMLMWVVFSFAGGNAPRRGVDLKRRIC